MAEPYLIRPPRPDEAAAIAEVHVQCWSETYSHLLPPGYCGPDLVVRRTAMWSEIIDTAGTDRRLAVAERDGRLIGLAAAGDPLAADAGNAPRQLHLYSLYVVADHHGSGAGQALFEAAVSDDPAFLWVAADNPRAQKFYRRNGFRADGTTLTDGLGIVELRYVR